MSEGNVVHLEAHRQKQQRFSVQVTYHPNALPTVSRLKELFQEIDAYADLEGRYAIVEGVYSDDADCIHLNILTWKRGDK